MVFCPLLHFVTRLISTFWPKGLFFVMKLCYFAIPLTKNVLLATKGHYFEIISNI